MPRPERGRTAAGFREQVLARLRNVSREQGVPVDRLQQRVAFERFLARLAESGDWVLMGGFALELRYGWGNRPTRDIDLRTELPPAETLALLRATVAEQPAVDHFRFELGEAAAELQGAPLGGLRVRVTARVAGVMFAAFAIDLSSGDALVQPPDELVGSNLLEFAGIAPVRFPVYPVAQHLAEKLHAYTLRRAESNTRVKDLVDMVTIAAMSKIDGAALKEGVVATFAARGTHALPAVLPEPPAAWRLPFRQLATEAATGRTTELQEGYEIAGRLWEPILSDSAMDKLWSPEALRWLDN